MISSTSTTQIDDFLERFISPEGLPGLTAMAATSEGILYKGAFGYRDVSEQIPMRDDSVIQIASATKAITAAAALQLVESGRLELDRPIERYTPEAQKLVVLTGWNDHGEPITRAPKKPITARHLLTHTSGLSYEFWNADIVRYMEAKGIPGLETLSRSCLFTPLIADPGETWEYGISYDWLGLVIEAVSGMDLETFLKTKICDPLGMTSTAFTLTEDMAGRLAKVHHRNDLGKLAPTDFVAEQNGEFKEGGGGLYSTCADYLRFIRMILNKGRGEFGSVLNPQTVKLMQSDAVGANVPKPLIAIDRDVSNDFEFFPGLRKSWTLGFMRNEDRAPTGRSPGSLGWAGLFNTYYWIDPGSNLGGIATTQLVPFGDDIAIDAFYGFERHVYDAVKR